MNNNKYRAERNIIVSILIDNNRKWRSFHQVVYGNKIYVLVFILVSFSFFALLLGPLL